MENYVQRMAIGVFTSRGKDQILREGGSQAWKLDAKRARKRRYVICFQNRSMVDCDWAEPTASQGSAFIVGRLKDVIPSTEGSEDRWMLKFSEYAEINVPNAWPGQRNPVCYVDSTELAELLNGIDVTKLNFEKMPEPEVIQKNTIEAVAKPLTIAEAKAGLSVAFDTDPSNIEITIRG